MSHPLQCSCGLVRGNIALAGTTNRCVCYCKDCRAFAHFLGRPGDILDQHGGMDIVQLAPKRVQFTHGIENLACMRLSSKGLMRWYASCCNTPIGNTLEDYRLSFVGLVHSCMDSRLESGRQTLDQSFGPVAARVNTKGAKGATIKAKGELKTVARIGAMILRARIDGSYRQTPFYIADAGSPIVVPKVISAQERENLKKAVGA